MPVPLWPGLVLTAWFGRRSPCVSVKIFKFVCLRTLPNHVINRVNRPSAAFYVSNHNHIAEHLGIAVVVTADSAGRMGLPKRQRPVPVEQTGPVLYQWPVAVRAQGRGQLAAITA